MPQSEETKNQNRPVFDSPLIQKHRFEFGEVEDIKRLYESVSTFDGSDVSLFKITLILQCVCVPAESGCVLKIDKDNGTEILAEYSTVLCSDNIHSWIPKIIEQLSQKTSHFIYPIIESDSLYGQPTTRHISVHRFAVDADSFLALFLIRASSPEKIKLYSTKLDLFFKYTSVCRIYYRTRNSQSNLERIAKVIKCVSCINRELHFLPSAMSLCNELNTLWGCERVSVGIFDGKNIRLKAVSHSEDFSKNAPIVKDIESVMEECGDQNIEILFPPDGNSTYICLMSKNFSDQYGSAHILSLPLRFQNNLAGVITMERRSAEKFTFEDIEAIRLSCELFTPRLFELYNKDRPLGLKVVKETRHVLSFIAGETHTWTKLLCVLIFSVILMIIILKGNFKVDAPFRIQTVEKQIIPAPYDGYLKNVFSEIGEKVESNNTILAQLDTSELRLQLAAAKAERQSFEKQFSADMRDNKAAQAQIAQANISKLDAQINLLNYQLDHAEIKSPIDGIILQGELKKQIGAPVKMGDILFEIAPIDSLRAELFVSEEDIFYVKQGQRGSLMTASYPDKKIGFQVEQIIPTAEINDKKNVFRIRVRLDESYSWMKPGMEGIAKVTVDRKPYIWIWTRKAVNWLRIKLWL